MECLDDEAAANETAVEIADTKATAQIAAADVDESSVSDGDDQAKQTDVQHSYDKYLCSSERKCYDDLFPKDYYDDPSSVSD